MRSLACHFRKHRERKPFDFFWRVTLESFVLSVALALILHFAGVGGREMPSLGIGEWFLLIVVVAPVFETIGLQLLPIEILRLLNAKLPVQIAVSTVLFFIPHAIEDIGTGITAGLLGGFYLAFIYAHLRGRSWWSATWMTIASHAIHNLLAMGLALATGDLPVAG